MNIHEFCWTKTIVSVIPDQPVAQLGRWCTKLEWKDAGNPIKKNHTYKKNDSKFLFLMNLTLLPGTKHKSILCWCCLKIGTLYLCFASFTLFFKYKDVVSTTFVRTCPSWGPCQNSPSVATDWLVIAMIVPSDRRGSLGKVVGSATAEEDIIAKVFLRKLWGRQAGIWHEKGWESRSGGYLWHSSRVFLWSLGLGAFFTPIWKDNAVCVWRWM